MFDPATKQIVHTQTRANARACCEAALQRLGTTYIDLFTLRGPVQVCVCVWMGGCMCARRCRVGCGMVVCVCMELENGIDARYQAGTHLSTTRMTVQCRAHAHMPGPAVSCRIASATQLKTLHCRIPHSPCLLLHRMPCNCRGLVTPPPTHTHTCAADTSRRAQPGVDIADVMQEIKVGRDSDSTGPCYRHVVGTAPALGAAAHQHTPRLRACTCVCARMHGRGRAPVANAHAHAACAVWGMQALVAEGKVRHVGLSEVGPAHIR